MSKRKGGSKRLAEELSSTDKNEKTAARLKSTNQLHAVSTEHFVV
jgi:hypothetical protein